MKSILTILALCLLTAFVKAQTTAMSRFQDHKLANPAAHYKLTDDIKWKFKTGGKIFSSPVISNEIILIGSEDKNLYALDVKNGQEKWKFETGGAVHSSVAVLDNTVFFGSLDGYYYALDFTTGAQKWKFKTGGEKRMGDTSYWGQKPAGVYMEDLWDCFISSPIVDKNEGETVYFGSSDGNLYAIDAKSGSLKWKFKTKNSIHSSPTLYNGIIYIGSWDTYLYAIDAKTGQEKWRFKTGDQMAMAGIQASPTVENGVVYFGARDAYLYALNAYNGNLLWKYDAQNSWIVSSVVVYDGVVYVGTSDSYSLLAVDAKTGIEKFRFKANGYVFDTPAIGGGTAYFGDFTGNLYAVDLASKGKRWNKFSTEARKQRVETILKKDTLDFMYAAKGSDLSFYLSNKKVMDDFYSLGSIVSSPVIKDNVVYFGSADGYLYALALKR